MKRKVIKMNERFKFRVWDKDYRRYHKDAQLYRETGEFYPDIENCYCFGDFLKQPARFIVEQCTGLKDKNGELVYEGDIARIGTHTFNCTVVYQDGCFWLDYETPLHEITHLSIEIIGNIHDKEGK